MRNNLNIIFIFLFTCNLLKANILFFNEDLEELESEIYSKHKSFFENGETFEIRISGKCLCAKSPSEALNSTKIFLKNRSTNEIVASSRINKTNEFNLIGSFLNDAVDIDLVLFIQHRCETKQRKIVEEYELEGIINVVENVWF